MDLRVHPLFQHISVGRSTNVLVELWNNPTSGHISEFINTIPGEIIADSEDSDEICYEVAHKQSNSS